MDLRAFLPPLAAATRITDHDLLERDVRLHVLLAEISADPRLSEDLVFKGGTLLIKCHVDYSRFSEDLDFTWRRQPRVPEGTGAARRRPFDALRRRIVPRLDAAAERAGLRRGTDDLKVDRHGQLLTVRYAYRSATGAPRHIKLEVSLLEPFLYDPVPATARSLLPPPPPAALVLADRRLADVYTRAIETTAYDAREARAEKVRALVTRGAVRGRDIHDLFELDRRGLRIEDAIEDGRRKVQFSTANWDRYRVNDAWRQQVDATLRGGEVGRLALKPVDESALRAFARRLVQVLPAALRSA